MNTNAQAPSAQNATGPRTLAGKAIAARNATTHGLFARDIVLPSLGEDPAAYEALLQQILNELPPRNLLERHYLEQIAAASWRLRRLHRWQAQVYEDPTLDEDQRLDKLDKTLRHENTLTRQIDRAVRSLGRALKDLYGERAEQEARFALDAPERGDARTEAGLAVRLQREVRRRLHPSLTEAMDHLRLDNDNPAPADAPQRQNEQWENCQNEPLPTREAVAQQPKQEEKSAEGGQDGRPRHESKQTAGTAADIATETAQKCENEPRPAAPPREAPADRILLASQHAHLTRSALMQSAFLPTRS